MDTQHGLDAVVVNNDALEEFLIACLPFARIRKAENQPEHAACAHSVEETASQQMALLCQWLCLGVGAAC